MTRINVIPVEELCDQMLFAEHRELTRIPNAIVAGRYSMADQPKAYTLGKGHVKFFYDKLKFLDSRYTCLHLECRKRGFNVEDKWPHFHFAHSLCKDYRPTKEAIRINRERIALRLSEMKRKPTWTNR